MKITSTQLKGGNRQMPEEKKSKGRKPDYKGTIDVAAWIDHDDIGNTRMAVVIGNRAKLVPIEEFEGQAE